MGRAVDERIRATIRTGQRVSATNHPARRLSSDLSEQKNHALNLVRDSVMAVDASGHITYLNRAAEQLSGWTTLEAAGRVARATLFAAGKSAFDAAWREVREKGEWRGTISLRTKSGGERPVESHWSALYEGQSSRITSILMVSVEAPDVNVTAGGLAHEIRNPLAGIKGVADAFLQRAQLTPQEREWMEAVRDEVMRIDGRIREFLELSQLRAVSESFLSNVIGRVVLLATHQLQSNDDCQITVEFVDATTNPIVIPTDSARIEDAVLNLVLNAIESIDGSGRVSVSLRRKNSAKGDGEALIEVTDTGCGVPPQIRERIFEPLFTTKVKGTGLGLAAVRRTAAAYHGRITFKTRIGRGSTFVLALPLRSQLDLTESPKSRLSLFY
jgi:PAS domain S-box-containing protein